MIKGVVVGLINFRSKERRWIIASAAPRFSITGENLIQIFVSFEDITELRAAKSELEEANKRLAEAASRSEALAAVAEKANHAKTEFLSRMSLEIRTPMNSILGFSELALGLIDARHDESLKHHLNIINASGKDLLTMVSNILDLVKIEEDGFAVVKSQFKLRKTIADVGGRMEERAAAKDLRISTSTWTTTCPTLSWVTATISKGFYQTLSRTRSTSQKKALWRSRSTLKKTC